MTQGEDDRASGDSPVRRRRWPRFVAGVLVVVVLLAAGIWIARERLVRGVVDDMLADMDLPARYDIAEIGPDRQVLANIVVGDRDRPDLVIEQAVVATRLRFGVPEITGVRLVRPRLYGMLHGDRVSFGALDRLLYPESTGEPFRLPDLDIDIVDGRARVLSPHGNLGVKLAGGGNLRDGFAATMGAVVPRLSGMGCTIDGLSLYGRLAIADETPRFVGPLRADAARCPESDLSLVQASWTVRGEAQADMSRAMVAGTLRTGRVAVGGNAVGALNGPLAVSVRDSGAMVADFDLSARDAVFAGAAVARLSLDGIIRSAGGFDRWQLAGDVAGGGFDLSGVVDPALQQVQESAADTLLAPIAGRLRAVLRRSMPGASFTATLQARADEGGARIAIARAGLRGGDGAPLLSLSQVQIGLDESLRLHRARFATGGADMPRIVGAIDGEGDRPQLRLRMADYAGGGARIAIPELRVRQSGDGFVMNGEILASGPLPGGAVDGLRLPVAGSYSARRGVRLWDDCVAPRFDSLRYANFTLERQSLLLCPAGGAAMLAIGPDGTRMAVGAPKLDLSGRLGETPVRLASGPVGLALRPGRPAVVRARTMNVEIGPQATAVRFAIADITAQIGRDIGGAFSGTNVTLPSVPLDIGEAGGQWSYRSGVLRIEEGAFVLTDRQDDARFEPMIARDATLTLADNIITANALFREPKTGIAIVDADIRHDLTDGQGRADLSVEGIGFGDDLQPTDITRLVLGNIANARGIVSGQGRIDWSGEGITSSGVVGTDSLDFAAAFGPVTGMAGTLLFTDLLNLQTAPDQRLSIAEMNPGVPVSDGEVFVTLRPGLRLDLGGGSWPFLGGRLVLEPTSLILGATERRNFTLVITGLDAGRVIERLGVANLSASGTFDGRIPIVFDEAGGRVEGGSLRSRPPGGNIAYVGELSYKDLSPIANFAFAALRSLDYKRMSVAIDGALEGEIVTRVRFDGVSQGPGTQSNFLTRRIAKLPFRFNVNIRAPFYQLIGSLKSLYDPSAVRDPRELGLVDDDGVRLIPDDRAVPAPSPPSDPPPIIQPAESETVP
ncbi:intermembrane phospholipid transport protein YdbH family protein [Croceicoccus hydrothermalis]|uniref:intermembrane phospholipid transport protein YdbH family protein n=1 Tax=Croceicoccus hydrothermalis TaxID=2867964 RepID=UPI001EFA6BA5|nr:YdbH domain-containing protein [Croceicoccus hydrothermalis]